MSLSPQKILPTPKRLLFIPLRYLGDTILSIPLIRNLRHHFPETQIHVLVSKTAKPLLENCPYIDQILVEPNRSKERIPAIKAGHYDTAIILRKSFTMAFNCRRAGIKTVIGYDKQRFIEPISFKRWGLLLDYKTPYPSRKTHVNQAISHLNHLKAYGLEAHDNHLELWPSPEDKKAIQALFESSKINTEKPIAVIHSISASSGKSIPIQHFVESVKQLAKSGYQIICTGLSNDYPLYQTLSATSGVPLHNFAGKTKLLETFALYQKADLILSVDSSPIHLAATADIPKIVGIYMTTNEKQWGPHSATSQFFPAVIPPKTSLDSKELGKRILSAVLLAIR